MSETTSGPSGSGESGKLRITCVYTRTGDAGDTRLGGGQKVPKDDARIRAFGAVDELNASVGLVLAGELGEELRSELLRIQNDLFHAGADLCIREEDKAALPPLPRIEARHIARLEAAIDRLQEDIPPLKEFVLPGGTEAAARLHQARAVCRRAESDLVTLARRESIGEQVLPFLNRLSDLLFVMSRHENLTRGHGEVLWDKDA